MDVRLDTSTTGTLSSAKADRPERARTIKRSPYPKVVGQGLYAAAKVRGALWDRALRHVEETQEKQLLRIVRHAKDTTFGRRYGFADIRSYEQYAARVPVGHYDSFAPSIQALPAGETGLLPP